MSWLGISILAYFLFAVESVINKFLLTGKIKSWKVCLFYSGVLSFFGLGMAVLGLSWPGWYVFFLSVVSGMILFMSLMFLFHSLHDSSASRVYAVSGAVTALFTFLLTHSFEIERISFVEFFGILLLSFGGFLMSFKVYKLKVFRGFNSAVASGFFNAASLVILKYTYQFQNFASGYVFSRIGIVLVTLAVFSLAVSFKKEISGLFSKHKKKERAAHFLGMTGAKILAGIGALILSYAISIGGSNLTVINSLSAVQYFFVFVFATVLAFKFKDEMREYLDKKNIFYKTAGVVLIALGVIFVAL